MFVLSGQNLRKYIGDRLLFSLDHFHVEAEQKIGVVGRNGEGKTTLLRCLAGEEALDEGDITCAGTIDWISQWSSQENINLSGGEWTKRKITKALSAQPAILFADEPTSHLDMDGVQWLEKELVRFSGAILLISHDRALLDAVCTQIWEVDHGKVKIYPGNYKAYRQQKEHHQERVKFEYEEYVKEKKHLEQAATEKRSKASKMNIPPKRMSTSDSRPFKAGIGSRIAKVDKQQKSLQTRLNKLERKERPLELAPIQFDVVRSLKITGKNAIRFDELTKNLGPRKLFGPLTCTIPVGKKVALLGKNGIGKSTLLQMIFDGAPGIKIAPQIKIGYFQQQLAGLQPEENILENVSKKSPFPETFIRTILARLNFTGDDILKVVSSLSGGEKVKVALAQILLSNANVLLLDEPTNFLDIYAREELENMLKSYPGTILFASHDRQLVSRVADNVLVLEDGEAIYYAETYEEYLQGKGRKQSIEDGEQQLMVLQNELSELIGRLSLTQDAKEKMLLEERYQKLLDEIADLKSRRGHD